MKIEISKQTTVIEEIDIELPYYYKVDLMSDYSDHIYYGKISENNCQVIDEIFKGDDIVYEIKLEKFQSIKNSGYSCYFKKESESTKEEFEAVKNRMKEFLNKLD